MALINAPEEDVTEVSLVHLFDAQFNLLAPIDHPILDGPRASLKTIADQPFIVLTQQSYTRRYFEKAM